MIYDNDPNEEEWGFYITIDIENQNLNKNNAYAIQYQDYEDEYYKTNKNVSLNEKLNNNPISWLIIEFFAPQNEKKYIPSSFIILTTTITSCGALFLFNSFISSILS